MVPENASLREELEARLRFETLIADLSSKFVNLPSGELDREIENAQRRICELLDLDRSTLWRISDREPGEMILTHLYRRVAVAPVPARTLGRDFFPWSTKRVFDGEIIAISKLAEFPPEADRDRESHILYDTKSSLLLPLSVGGGPVFGVAHVRYDPGGEKLAGSARETAPAHRADIRQLAGPKTVGRGTAREQRSGSISPRIPPERVSGSSDLATEMFWVTKRNRELLGFSPDELVTLDRFLSVVHPEDRDLVGEKVRSVTRTGDEDRVDYRIVRPDGSVRWVSSRGGTRPGASGSPDRLMGVTVDITERKQAEEAARELSGRLITAHEEERSRLARELHDDVTQRLARLAIDAGRVESLDSDPEVRETMREVREGLVRLSEDIHALSYRLHPSVLEDLGLAEALKTEIERVARQESISVTAKLDEIPESVPHDVALCLFRVAQESLRNVARHAKARTVEVAVRALDGGLQLAVRDDGAGFDSALTRQRRTLGLTSMQERVRLLRGELDIESAPGQRHDRRRLGAVEEGVVMNPPKRPRVLLADDHRMVAEGLKSLLAPEFDLVGVVEDGRALLEAAKRLKPDVIVADISMPNLNGIDAVAQLKQHDKEVRVVFLTMHQEVVYARRALDAGALGYVLKHSAPAELVAAIRAALDGKTYVTPSLAGEVLQDMTRGARRGARSRGVAHAAAAADPAASRRRAVGEGDRRGAGDLSSHGGVSQVPDDGDAESPHQRRADPFRHQARHRRNLIRGSAMTTIRKIKKVLKSRPTIEGAGVHLKRAFGWHDVPELDPFLLLDDFHSGRSRDYLAGFPWHPHRGIETITYVLEGTVEHGDSMGNKGVISPGDVQWMTAGSGIVHQEMPKGRRGRSPVGIPALGQSSRLAQDDGAALSEREGERDSGASAPAGGVTGRSHLRRGRGRARARARHRDRSGVPRRHRPAGRELHPSAARRGTPPSPT